MLLSVNWPTVNLVSDLMPSDRQSESSVFTSGPNKVNTVWSLPGLGSRTNRSCVTPCLCFSVIWLAQSFRVLHPTGSKSNRSPEGSNCDCGVSSSENNTRTCLFSTQLIDQETSSCCLTNVWTRVNSWSSNHGSQSEGSVSWVWG